MIAINRTKFGLFDRSKNKPKNTKHFITYKDEFYTSGKFTYPISIFLDILDSHKEELGCRYLLKKEDGKYLLFLPPYEIPVVLDTLDIDTLNRINLFSNGLETVNFDIDGFGRTSGKEIIKALKKMPKVTSRYGFIYLGLSVALVYFLAFGITNSIMGIFQKQLDEKKLQQTELNSQLFAINAELQALETQLKPNGTNGLNLELPVPIETFATKANRGDKLEQDNVMTVLPTPKEDI